MHQRFAWMVCVGLVLASGILVSLKSSPSSGVVDCSVGGEVHASRAVEKAQRVVNALTAIDEWSLERQTGNRQDSVAKISIVTLPSHGNFGFENQADLKSTYAVQLVNFEEEGADSEEFLPAGWPSADSLIEQIDAVQSIPEMARWSEATVALLEGLATETLGSNRINSYLTRLDTQARALPVIAGSIWERMGHMAGLEAQACAADQHGKVSRLAYRLGRRLVVWKTLAQNRDRANVVESFSDVPTKRVATPRISYDHLDPRWAEYLQLEELKSAFETLNPDPAAKKEAARKVLARVYAPTLRPDQAEYIQQVVDPTIVRFLRVHASSPLNQKELLERIENYEADPSAVTSYYLNDTYQDLLWSDNESDHALASELQTHYRNANFRLAVSQELMNRMIPELPTTASPVSQTIKGARVSGQSQVTNQLRVNLIPNANQINLQVATEGQVRSDTIARTNTFRIQNLGHAKFHVVKTVSISPRGIDSTAKPYASSSGNQSVVSLQSKLDDIPILGWMARKVAAKKLREEAPETDRMFQQTVKSSAESQMQKQVDVQLAKLRDTAYTNLFQPLLAMELEPEAVQMATTEQQVVMRYRLAGRDQLGAHTARPRDSGGSLLSFQLHETAINNSIARIGLSGEKFTIDELKQHLRGILGTDESAVQDEPSEEYAEIGFAPLDPIRIEFQDDRVFITLNLKSFKIGEDGKVWKYISMKAAYKLSVDGMSISLEQDDDLTRLHDPRRRLKLGDRAAILTVMKVLFKKEYSLNALPKSIADRLAGQTLEVSQLVVSDGWLAASIDDAQASLAGRDESDADRMGAIRRLFYRR